MAAEIVLYLLILVWVDTRRMQNLGLCGPNADPVAPLTKTALADDADVVEHEREVTSSSQDRYRVRIEHLRKV